MKLKLIILIFLLCYCSYGPFSEVREVKKTEAFWPPDLVPHPIPPEYPDPRDPPKEDPLKDLA